MKIKEIIEMSTDELLTKKRDLRQESLHLRLQQQSGQLEQPSRLRLLRATLRASRQSSPARRRKATRNSYGRTRSNHPVTTAAIAGIVTRSSRKTRTGEVISSSMNKTIVVRTVTRVPHPQFRQDRQADAEVLRARRENKAKTGDTFESWKRGR
jgi:ribosomal protein L29